MSRDWPSEEEIKLSLCKLRDEGKDEYDRLITKIVNFTYEVNKHLSYNTPVNVKFVGKPVVIITKYCDWAKDKTVKLNIGSKMLLYYVDGKYWGECNWHTDRDLYEELLRFVSE